MSDLTETLSVTIGEATHAGNVGKNNEDAYLHTAFTVPALGGMAGTVAVVADGIGGSQAGELASRRAVQVITDYFIEHATANPLDDLRQAMTQASEEIIARAEANPQLAGMGTTATAVVILGRNLYVANVGDSRAYLIRGDQIHQLTIDHTWAQEAIEAGRLTPEEAMKHPNRNVLKRYLGLRAAAEVDLRIQPLADARAAGEKPAVGLQPLRLERGDKILLCSDGLTDLVPDEEILPTVRKYAPQRAADELVKQARAHGGLDNITVLVLGIDEQPPPSRPKPRLTWPYLVAAVAVLIIAVSIAVYVLVSRRPTTGEATAPPGAEVVPTTAAALSPLPTPKEPTEAIPTTSAALSPLPTPAPATATPVPTFTPTLPRPTRPTRPAYPQVELIYPRPGDSGSTWVPFEWHADFQLAEGDYFELVFWKKGQDPYRDAFGLVSPTKETKVLLNLQAVDRQLPQLEPGEYLWGVLAVRLHPYERIRLLSKPRRFRYYR